MRASERNRKRREVDPEATESDSDSPETTSSVGDHYKEKKKKDDGQKRKKKEKEEKRNKQEKEEKKKKEREDEEEEEEEEEKIKKKGRDAEEEKRKKKEADAKKKKKSVDLEHLEQRVKEELHRLENDSTGDVVDDDVVREPMRKKKVSKIHEDVARLKWLLMKRVEEGKSIGSYTEEEMELMDDVPITDVFRIERELDLLTGKKSNTKKEEKEQKVHESIPIVPAVSETVSLVHLRGPNRVSKSTDDIVPFMTPAVWTSAQIVYRRKETRNAMHIRHPETKSRSFSMNKAQAWSMYEFIDEYFFSGWFKQAVAERKVPLEFHIKQKGARASGVCSTQWCPVRNGLKEASISLNSNIIEPLFVDKKETDFYISNGLQCYDQLEVILMTMEHEMLHLLFAISVNRQRQMEGKKREGHGKTFKAMMTSMFGHTSHRHELGVPGQQAVESNNAQQKSMQWVLEKGLKSNMRVTFWFRGSMIHGFAKSTPRRNARMITLYNPDNGFVYHLSPHFLQSFSKTLDATPLNNPYCTPK